MKSGDLTLLAAFKRIMSMSDFQTSWIEMAFYGSYFCLAIPAALFIKRYTYKSGILLGLGLFIMGALFFYPASKTMVYGHFLTALFVLAGGLAILETTTNPFIIAMGPEESVTRWLNLAQSFNPIGSIIGILLGKTYILSQLNPASAEKRADMDSDVLGNIQSAELSAVMGTYVVVAGLMVVLWILIYIVKMPKAPEEGQNYKVRPAIKRLFRNKNYLMGIVAQFFYVGAQIGIWSFAIRYVMKEMHLNEEQASVYYLPSLVLFIVSRFICTMLMRYVKPGVLLGILSLIAIGATGFVMGSGGVKGIYALVLISGCMSLMYPTIYSLAFTGMNKDTKIASSELVMAILGGAVLTPLQGWVSDTTHSINLSFVVPLFSFFVVFVYSIFTSRRVNYNSALLSRD